MTRDTLLKGSTLVLCAALAGCPHAPTINLPQPVRVASQEQAATVLVTPSMVAPWDDVSAALKPNFTMNGDTAVSEVLPTTEQIQSQVLSAFGATLGLGFPTNATQATHGETLNSTQGSNTSGGVTTTTASSNGTTTSSTTTTTTPGVAPTTPTGTPAGVAIPAGSTPTGTLGLDPILKFKAAAYLNQEVQLLNQEIDNAAVRRCFVPYVVKLKLAVMNYRPYLAYSVHTRVSFSAGPTGEPPPLPSDLLNAAKLVQAAGLFGRTQRDPKSNQNNSPFDAQALDQLTEAHQRLEAAKMSADCVIASKDIPVVIPFLVADDLEVALKSATSEVAKQLALAVTFMTHGIGASTGLSDLSATLNAISEQNLSSNLTVARDNDNTLYIQISPKNQASGDPTLVGQTYDVAVLLLVPRRYFLWNDNSPVPAKMSLVTFTQLRDATSGEILPTISAQTYANRINQVLAPYMTTREAPSAPSGSDKHSQISLVEPLLSAIEQGNFAHFRSEFAGGSNCTDQLKDAHLCLSVLYAPTLWTALSTIISDNPYKNASFEAPVPSNINIPPQGVLVADDKTHPIQVQISRVEGASASTLAGALNLVVRDSAVRDRVIAIPAQSIVLDPAAHVLTLTFPSLGKLGLAVAKPSRDTGPRRSPVNDENNAASPTIAAEDERNNIVIRRVNCDPMKRLCPAIKSFDGASTGQALEVEEVRLGVQFVSIPKASPNSVATLYPQGTVVTMDHGGSTGTLPFAVKLPSSGLPAGESLALTVAGGSVLNVLSATGTALILGKNGYGLPAAGVYVVNLVNLTPGVAITISVQAIKADQKTPDGDPATATFTAVPSASPVVIH